MGCTRGENLSSNESQDNHYPLYTIRSQYNKFPLQNRLSVTQIQGVFFFFFPNLNSRIKYHLIGVILVPSTHKLINIHTHTHFNDN